VEELNEKIHYIIGGLGVSMKKCAEDARKNIHRSGKLIQSFFGSMDRDLIAVSITILVCNIFTS